MRPSILQLRQFYSSRLGRQVKKHLRKQVLQLWPSLEQESIVGVGYAPPLLRVLERKGDKPHVVIALMPADQGAIYWPVHTDNRSILGDEMLPPFADNTLQRIVMLHVLEFVEKPEELLRVYWQMLAPGGRLVLVVPNRYGLWAHAGRSPFRRGHAYSMQRVKDLLEEAQFTLCESGTALFAPPNARRIWLQSSALLEWLGNVLLPGFGGVIVVEAEKQIYASIAIPVVAARRAHWAEGTAMPVTERTSTNNRI